MRKNYTRTQLNDYQFFSITTEYFYTWHIQLFAFDEEDGIIFKIILFGIRSRNNAESNWMFYAHQSQT